MRIIEVKNKQALASPELQALLQKMVDSSPVLAPQGLSAAAGELISFIERPDHFFLLGAEAGAFKSIVLGMLPQSVLFPYPQVVMAYNEGSRDLKIAMHSAILDAVTSAGYTTFWTFNVGKHSDKAWLRTFQHPDGEFSKIGSLMEFKIA